MNIIEDLNSSRAMRFFVMAAASVIIIAGMRLAQAIVVPFLLSAFIAIICTPSLFWLRRKKIPLGVALVIVIASISAVGVIIAAIIGTSLGDFSTSLPEYQKRLEGKTAELFTLLERFGIVFEYRRLLEYIDPGAAMRLASKMLTGLGNVLSNTVLIILTVIFMLLEAATFPVKLRSALGSSTTTIGAFMNDINRYMVIKTWASLATGILVTIWMAVLGVDYPILWGILAFMLNYVPNIGSIIAAVPAVMLALIQQGLAVALLAVAGYILVNLLIGTFIEPRYMGKGLGLSTLVVFLSLVFWGWILGPVGMLLSVPLTMAVKIALSCSEDTQWLSILLGNAVPEEALDKK
ncbi:MAG: AI-2E family transporter [Syntrophales bacterium]|nr:AI-2E family transporter [Syntrophales bacterium]